MYGPLLIITGFCAHLATAVGLFAVGENSKVDSMEQRHLSHSILVARIHAWRIIPGLVYVVVSISLVKL